MRVFIVAGSPVARRPSTLEPGSQDRVIAADRGALHAFAWGWPVHLLVGDLDSLPAAIVTRLDRSGTAIERAPAAKDETDTELALARARELGPEQIVICGAGGGRIDHLLANLLLLARPELAALDVCIVDGGETVRLLQASAAEVRLHIEGAAGDLVSLLPLGADTAGVTTRDLLYPLRAETLYEGAARGMSNVMTTSRAQVSLQRGRLLVIHTRIEER